MSAPLTVEDLRAIDLGRLQGVGEKRLAAFAQLEVRNVLDLVTHYPRRYIDRTNEASIASLTVGEEAMVLAHVDKVVSRRTRNGRTMVTVTVRDDTAQLSCTFFNQPWREKQLKPGTEAVFFGKLDIYRGYRQMANPVVDLVGDKTGKILPVYPQSEKAGLSTWEIGSAVAEALRG
jgi:ATP-dependent DNA helicase RecG